VTISPNLKTLLPRGFADSTPGVEARDTPGALVRETPGVAFSHPHGPALASALGGVEVGVGAGQ
jgi:hypothetical protein